MSLGIGIAGLASYYSSYYAERAAKRSDTSVVAAAHLDATDRQLEALGRRSSRDFSARYGCELYDSVAALAADEAVDAIVLGSLLTRRAEDAVTILDAGIPVLTGKPAAESAAEAERIAETAEDRQLLAATTAPHRYDGRITEAHRRVAAGAIGDVIHLRASVFHSKARPDGIEAKDGLAPGEPGPAYTMGYYVADLARWFAGPSSPSTIVGALENGNSPFMEHPDHGSATLRFDDGTLAGLAFAMCTEHGPGYGWEITVHGTEGTIQTGHDGYEGHQWSGDDGGSTEAFGRTLDPVLDHQFDAFVEALEASDDSTSVSPGPADAARGIAICDAWVEAARQAHPVPIER